MNTAQRAKPNSLYQHRVSSLQCQGNAATINFYARAVCRVTENSDHFLDCLVEDQPNDYLPALFSSHSISTVKIGRNSLQYFYKHVLNSVAQQNTDTLINIPVNRMNLFLDGEV